jgi:hypothetical protein
MNITAKILRTGGVLAAIMLFPAVSMLQAAEVSIAQVNRTLGMPVFAQKNSWDLRAFHQRTKLSLTGNAGRYSARGMGRKTAGCPIVEVVVNANDRGRITAITFVFANKGDTAEKHEAKIRETGKNIKKALTSLLGPASKERPRPGYERSEVWNFARAKIALEIQKGEFAMLHILPPAAAGNSSGTTNYSKNVKRSDFGDVWIENIPMVDQGPKGYCVPATMERVLRYFGQNIDQHHLADIGGTNKGGGTRLDEMLRDIGSIRRKSKLKQIRFSAVSTKNVARFIDQGYPVMWAMFSTRELMEVYTFSIQNRPRAASQSAWIRTIKKLSVPRKEDGAHICLIIGYNRETDEIGISNSWGAGHIKPIWIPVKVANRISQKELLVFQP